MIARVTRSGPSVCVDQREGKSASMMSVTQVPAAESKRFMFVGSDQRDLRRDGGGPWKRGSRASLGARRSFQNAPITAYAAPRQPA